VRSARPETHFDVFATEHSFLYLYAYSLISSNSVCYVTFGSQGRGLGEVPPRPNVEPPVIRILKYLLTLTLAPLTSVKNILLDLQPELETISLYSVWESRLHMATCWYQ